MLSEIRQQPAALERTLTESIRLAEDLRRRLQSDPPRLIVIAARGTSDAAALFGKYLIEIATGIPVALAAPSISTIYKTKLQLEGALVVAISQSGESTDINCFLERAREQRAMTLGITNGASSVLSRLAEHTLLLQAGAEESVAATKTYTGEILLLYLLVWALGGEIDLDRLRRLPGFAEAALSLESEIGSIVTRYTPMERAAVLGRGLNYSNAFEFALKLMETCYVVAERFSSADFLHGPIAVVEPSFPMFVFAPAGPTWPSTQTTLGRLAELGAKTLVITDNGNPAVFRTTTLRVPVSLSQGTGPAADELYTPIPYIIPAQIFAALLSEKKGLNPDEPRGLGKVTLTL